MVALPIPVLRKLVFMFVILCLCIAITYHIWPSRDITNCAAIRECQMAINKLPVATNLSTEQQQHLTRLIHQHFLKPPVSSELPLKLNYPMWASPVTALVLKLLQNKKYGFFIEAGALNGEEISNTIQLEVTHKWEGLLVEPDPRNLAQLYAKNRKSWVAPVCLSPTGKPEKMPMLIYNRFRHMTNIPGLAESQNLKGMEKDTSTLYEIQCFSLYSLLMALNRSDVDYLSLDVEGAEIGVLKSLPFDKINIRVISVEMNNKDEIFEFLKSKGYELKQVFDLPDKGVRDAVFFIK